jgi:AcrR family transcriptional regulator
MPRFVDHDVRRREIIDATLEILAEQGLHGLSFRTVAARLGGSSTIVTHYFPSKQALLDALAETVSGWPEEIAELEAQAGDAKTRLRLLLQWLVPGDERALMEERGRINLVGAGDTSVRTQHLLDTWDANVRDLLRAHLGELLPNARIDPTVDLLRALTNGLTLSAVEHPDDWPPQRQRAVLDDALRLLDLLPDDAA